MLNPTTYFAGGFVALETLVESIKTKIPTDGAKVDPIVEERAIVLKKLTWHLSHSYGKALYQLAHDVNMDYKALYDLLSVPGVPRRLEKSAVAGGVNRAHDTAHSMEK